MSTAIVDRHYGTASLVASVQQALVTVGFREGAIARDALSPLDQFHVGGAAATRDLAGRLGVATGERLLDVGCGLGGPARQLAAEYGCHVTGVDINAPFVELASLLTERVRLAAQSRFLVADATALPFEPESFELAWSQHVAMNIEDRAALYAGIRRVLVPGGRFAMYDVVTGNGNSIHFPVPWARDPAASFVIAAEATRHALEAAGFDVLEWRDATVDGIAWQQAQLMASQSRPDPVRRLGLPLIMGPQFPEMAANFGRNFQEGCLRLLQAIVRRRD